MRTPPADDSGRRYLRIAGIALGLGGIVFVAERLFTYGSEIDLSVIGPAGYAALAILCACYALSNVALSEGWRAILSHFRQAVPFRRVVRVYALSQLAKYLPGNIFHLVGRQALGGAAGIPHAVLAKSAILELAIIAICTALFAPLVLPLVWPTTGVIPSLALFGLASLAALLIGRRVFGTVLVRSALFYAGYLAASGAIFVGVLLLAGGAATVTDMPAIAGAYVLAWLVGLVTPGAPAGLGVREAALLFLLGGLAAPPVILLAVVMGRAVTVLGDLVFYLVGGLVNER